MIWFLIACHGSTKTNSPSVHDPARIIEGNNQAFVHILQWNRICLSISKMVLGHWDLSMQMTILTADKTPSWVDSVVQC